MCLYLPYEGFVARRCEGNMILQTLPSARLCGRSSIWVQDMPFSRQRVSLHPPVGLSLGYTSEIEALASQ